MSRLLGYANRHVLRVDHDDEFDPEPVLRETDDLVRHLPGPPRGRVRWVNVENLGTA